jgi:hypothetical protein
MIRSVGWTASPSLHKHHLPRGRRTQAEEEEEEEE